jgi:hypothetical protein
MNFTFINKVAMRTTAVLTVLTMVVGIVPPRAARAAGDQVAAPAVPSCRVLVVSKVGDTQGGVATFEHPVWNKDVGGQWLWSDAFVTNTLEEQIRNFTQTFIWGGDSVSDVSFRFAADNGYVVKLNGVEIGSEVATLVPPTDFHSGVTGLTVANSAILTGVNTLSFEITNLASPDNVNPEDNPAGFNFKMDIDGNGSACDKMPVVDVCSEIAGDQATTPAGYTNDGRCSPITITTGTAPFQACIGDNLIQNGSFENPVITSNYSVVSSSSVPNWLSSTDNFEIWRNLDGFAGQGDQNLELDVNTPSTISQSVATVPGNEYRVKIAFSPRVGTPANDNKVEVVFGGDVLGTVSADGTGYPSNVWTAHNFIATASGANSLLELRDLGSVTDGYGTLIDDVVVCLVKNNTPEEETTSTISGYKFNDENSNGIWDTESEDGLPNWEIVLNQGESEPVYTTTNNDGYYSFKVTNGSYQVSETQQAGWEQTATIGENADGDICYINVENENFTCDFGNHETERRSGGGGSSSGTRVGTRSGTPTGEVLGASTSTPTGVVLGDATTTMPVGAPNTGAGGTAPITVSLPTLVAILSTSTRKSK